MGELKHIFKPVKVGELELKNRLVVLAMGTGYTKDTLNDRFKAFILERAKGRPGLLIVSLSSVSSGVQLVGEGGELMPGIYEDSFIPDLQELTHQVHTLGTRLAAQLLITNEWSRGKGFPTELVAPSPVSKREGGHIPRALTLDEIHQIVDEMGAAALRARKAGFDAVEIHAGVGLLINQFISPVTNKRNDEYGGNQENRLHFPLEVIHSIKQKAGNDYPLIVRLCAEEFLPGGLKLDDWRTLAPIVEKAGADCLNIQPGWHESPVSFVQMSVPRGAYVYLAEEIKKVVKIPVITAYRINDPLLANQIVAGGRADLIGMARAFVADPEFARKAEEERVEDIRPCIACCHCLDLIFSGKPLSCTVNPRVGKELEYRIEPASRPKQVLVIGGGPAGMEAARVAAQRGHTVTLWEEKDRLGGQMFFASLPPYKQEIAPLIRYYEVQLKKKGVKVILNKKATPAEIIRSKPDAIIIATGASQIIPDIPGIDGKNVVKALDVLAGKEVGNKVVIIGGGMIGCETAEFLLEKGKSITLLEMLPRIGADIGIINRWVILDRLRKAGAKMETKTKAVEITPVGVKAQKGGATVFFEGEVVVLAVGMKSDNELAQELQAKVPSLWTIGDCTEPQRITQAVEAGLKAGIEV